MSKVIFETKDCDYGLKLTIDWNNLIKVEPHNKGTELSEKDVINLIRILSSWLDDRNRRKPSIDTKPMNCPICSNKEQDNITNIIKGVETDTWFCLKCGGLIGWIK